MNKKEFSELQTQIASLLIEYENFCKKGYQLDLKYNYTFCELLMKEERIKFENNLIIGVCTMLADKKSMEEVDAFIQKQKNEYNALFVRHSQKVTNAAQVLKAMKELPAEIVKLLEDSFNEYVLNYHPAVKYITSEEEGKLYEYVRKAYYDNNYSAFKEMLELNKNILKPADFKEEQYVDAASYYYSIMVEMNKDVSIKRTKYPYNIEEILESKISIAAYEADIRTRITKLTGANKALHKDLIEVYGEDIII